MPVISNYPKEITRDSDNNLQIASYGYYDGIAVAREKSLKQTTSFLDVFNKTHFIVSCGDVMIRVEETDYPELNRRVI